MSSYIDTMSSYLDTYLHDNGFDTYPYHNVSEGSGSSCPEARVDGLYDSKDPQYDSYIGGLTLEDNNGPSCPNLQLCTDRSFGLDIESTNLPLASTILKNATFVNPLRPSPGGDLLIVPGISEGPSIESTILIEDRLNGSYLSLSRGDLFTIPGSFQEPPAGSLVLENKSYLGQAKIVNFGGWSVDAGASFSDHPSSTGEELPYLKDFNVETALKDLEGSQMPEHLHNMSSMDSRMESGDLQVDPRNLVFGQPLGNGGCGIYQQAGAEVGLDGAEPVAAGMIAMGAAGAVSRKSKEAKVKRILSEGQRKAMTDQLSHANLVIRKTYKTAYDFFKNQFAKKCPNKRLPWESKASQTNKDPHRWQAKCFYMLLVILETEGVITLKRSDGDWHKSFYGITFIEEELEVVRNSGDQAMEFSEFEVRFADLLNQAGNQYTLPQDAERLRKNLQIYFLNLNLRRVKSDSPDGKATMRDHVYEYKVKERRNSPGVGGMA